MRPRTLAEFRGQEHLLGAGKAVRAMLDSGSPGSMILWGPPGSGKTTLARLFAAEADVTFVAFSAVTEGVARVRQIIAEADQRRRSTGKRTILFCDEIHRFNKAQQDAFLPHVESGTVILIGATTENPSFEVVRPLLSRAPVYVLEPLSAAELESILRDALNDPRGLAEQTLIAMDDAIEFMAEASDGDARRALGVLEAAAALAGRGGTLDLTSAKEALQHRFAIYDKGGEEHYNLISALHKSVRGSDPDGALYWLARMIDGGEDPLYIARRLVRMAIEDIGLADPAALGTTVAARDAYHFLGSPEGDLALAQATVYLATAPKSNSAYSGWKAALGRARETPSAPVPLHLRNAPTGLMKELGYGDGYRYDPSESDGVSDQRYLPESLHGERFYHPGRFGFEKTIAERLKWWESRRKGSSAPSAADDTSPT
ncbi:MAG: replication-associated recombination protein A [Gemmatimonadetes bacterium]|nr:replication-associated recombination protein A [Gemmatimonadota bacterium]MDA1104221.1 replication-associated recombination protein A [Gemmatimonadota bacterium]